MSVIMHPNALFFSDTHLSTLQCRIDDLLFLLTSIDAPAYYILGDLIDLWKLKTLNYWPDSHTEALVELLDKLYNGKSIKYIIGNHDDFFEEFIRAYQTLTIAKKDFVVINNKKLLIIHGDKFDMSVKFFKPLAVLGVAGYDLFNYANKWINKIKKSLGISPFSMSDYLDKKTLNLSKFRAAALEYAKKKGMDGIICGHTHIPELIRENGMVYANTGDFVTHSSFIVHSDSTLYLVECKGTKMNIVTELKP